MMKKCLEKGVKQKQLFYFPNWVDLKEIKPVIYIEVNPDRTVKNAKVVNQERLIDPSFRTAAEAAMRAVNNPECSPLLLPQDKYEKWKEINFTFDFSWMFD